MAKNLFFLGLIVAASGLVSPPLALTFGLIYGFTAVHPYHVDSRKLSRFLLQISVVALGFGMDLHQVARAGSSGFVYTLLSISITLAVGLALGRFFGVGNKSSFLITAGTAICGGSAIAAVGPIVKADDEEMAVSLGTIFVLNSVALLAFPPIGSALHLTQEQFGLWAALAIHDTSSVVGAAAHYGATALAVGTTVKLARALWIVPLSLATAMVTRSQAKIQWPWFILYFCLAAVANTYIPLPHQVYGDLSLLGRTGLTVTLYLIGTGLSKETLRKVGWRPMLQGVLLWAIVGPGALMLIRMGWIHL
ncbi:MAG: putative sulfate exporter family transporter [Acidobacteriota bacterium]|nr:putative sulfate exporter family transporter [Acidobacteriota bacterium]